MNIPSYLTASRHGLYYFRFPIPSLLHPRGKQSDIKLSLGTRCPYEASHLSRALGYIGQQTLKHPQSHGMNYQSTREMLHKHFRELLERNRQRLAIPAGDADLARLVDVVLPIQAAQDSPAPPKPEHRKLADAIEMYCTEKERTCQWRKHVASDYRSQFELLLEYVGKDAPLHVSPEMAGDVKAMLLRLPKNRNKGGLKHLTLLQQLKAKDAPRLSAVTINKHIISYSAFYDWAVKRKETNENNFRALIDNVKNAHAERDEFSPEQITRILNAVINTKEAHHKWGVLIGFYTGARVNEIAQLDTADIIQEDGVWCFRFTDEGQRKRLKNKASRRIIPIHSQLLQLGFLSVVADAGTGKLFPKLAYQSKHGYGRGISRWFNEALLPKLGIKSPSLMYHCIRHTVAQRLRNNKVPEATLKDILGHSHSDVTMSVYANYLDKRVMQEAIETLHYA